MTAPVAPPAPENPARPGYVTTEFWLAGVLPTVFLVLSQFNILTIDTNNPHVEQYAKLGSYILAAAGYGFYAHSRGKMKLGASIWAGISELASSLVHGAGVLGQAQKEVAAIPYDRSEPLQGVSQGFFGFTDAELRAFIKELLTELGIESPDKPTPSPTPDPQPAPTPAPVEPSPSLPFPQPDATP